MNLIFKNNVIGNCVLCISGADGLLGRTFIFAKKGSIDTTLFSSAYWFILLLHLSCFVLLYHHQPE